jgi:hypothetical protein
MYQKHTNHIGIIIFLVRELSFYTFCGYDYNFTILLIDKKAENLSTNFKSYLNKAVKYAKLGSCDNATIMK